MCDLLSFVDYGTKIKFFVKLAISLNNQVILE